MSSSNEVGSEEEKRTYQEDEGNFVVLGVWSRCPSVFSLDRDGALFAFDMGNKILRCLFGGGSIPRPILASINLPNGQTFLDGFPKQFVPPPERL